MVWTTSIYNYIYILGISRSVGEYSCSQLSTLFYMEHPRCVNFSYSLKNIPIPSGNAYKKRLIEKVENVTKRMRWRAFFFLENSGDLEQKQPKEEMFRFKSRKCPPQIDEVKPFEEDLLKMIKNIKFKKAVPSHP